MRTVAVTLFARALVQIPSALVALWVTWGAAAVATSEMRDPDLDMAKAIFVDYLGKRVHQATAVTSLQALVATPARSAAGRQFAAQSLAWIDLSEPDVALRPYFAELATSKTAEAQEVGGAFVGQVVRVLDARVAPSGQLRKLKRLVESRPAVDISIRRWAAVELCARGEGAGPAVRAAIANGYGATADAVTQWCEAVATVLNDKAWRSPADALRSIDVWDWSWSKSYLRFVLLAVAEDSRTAKDRKVVARALQVTTAGTNPGDLVTLQQLLPRLLANGWTLEQLQELTTRPELIERLAPRS